MVTQKLKDSKTQNLMNRFLLLSALLFLAACSGSDGLTPPELKPVEIILSTGFAPASASGVETRGEGSIYSDKLRQGATLSLSVVRIDQAGTSDPSYLPYTPKNTYGEGQAPRSGALGSGEPGNETAETSDPNLLLTFETDEYYLSRPRNNDTKLIAWYPAVGEDGSKWNVSVWSPYVATVDFTVDGETDILMSNLVEGDQLNPYNGADNRMVFRHLLTRLVVRVFTRDAGVPAYFGGVCSIAVAGKAQTCSVRLPDVDAPSNTYPTEITFTGTDDLPIIYRYPADNSPIAGYDNPTGFPIPLAEESAGDGKPDPRLAGYAMIAPGAEAIGLLIETSRQEGIPPVQVPAPPAGFAAGRSYTLTLEFMPNGIEVINVSILDWGGEEEETKETLFENQRSTKSNNVQR